MRLPKDFYYSQISLQDFADCRKRFYLRHLSYLPWPAVEMEPAMQHEHSAREGARFRQLVHQCLLGIPVKRLSPMVHDPDLAIWWKEFLEFLPQIIDQDHRSQSALYPEISLSAPLGDRRLLARYDLVVSAPDSSLVIYILKTSPWRPSREHLERLLLTRVLPYLLVRAGSYLNQGQPVDPSQVELVYWFSNGKDPVERFGYDGTSFRRDEGFLNGMVETISRLDAGDFSRTADERRCLYCSYRSLCERGVLPGNPFEPGIESLAGFELELISPYFLDD